LQQLNVSDSAKTALATILNAAVTPEGEGLDYALRNLPQERREIVEETAKSVGSVTRAIGRRGRAALAEVSDEEWQRLVDKANE